MTDGASNTKRRTASRRLNASTNEPWAPIECAITEEGPTSSRTRLRATP